MRTLQTLLEAHGMGFYHVLRPDGTRRVVGADGAYHVTTDTRPWAWSQELFK